jgi:hypothetical protein
MVILVENYRGKGEALSGNFGFDNGQYCTIKE